ncbi:MAG TPA: lytic transglycosylase domain-containing protein [Xanthobacteraceae bacterium]|jgi:soluble lytic murein transglycosylase-like protein|nr:lytic transglycosylase domain-containing protein [Xanthobacteraceae bacterium]
MIRIFLLGACALALAQPAFAQRAGHGELDSLIAKHAAANGLPEALVHRVIVRESRYNPRLVGRGGAMGLMQIKYATARGMGYTGSASGLLDAETNLTYAVRYLAGAYRAAGGNADRAVSYYARGYHDVAKRTVVKQRRVLTAETTGSGSERVVGERTVAKKEAAAVALVPSEPPSRDYPY